MTLMGLMQPVPLSIAHIFHRAEQQFGMKSIFGVEAGTIREVSVSDWAKRVRKLAGGLEELGVPAGAAVATFGFNSQRHLELYFAIPCTGRVLHPLNIRLSDENLQYIMTLAEDDIVFADRGLFAQLWTLADSLPRVRYWVVLDDGSDAPIPVDPRVLDYEQVLQRSEPFEGTFAIEDENQAAAICFTSGTTGNPKGVVYSHRSTVLHTLMTLASGLIGISERDTVMPIVPMFHASGWGQPYSTLFAGGNIVLPGMDLNPRALLGLIERLGVTVASAVPTVWAGALPYVDEFDLGTLRAIFGGGSATPERLADDWVRKVGVPITHTWGMTELSPTGAVGGLRSFHRDASEADKRKVLAAQGQAVPLVDLRIADIESGNVLPNDGVAVGELQAHGPTVAAGYLGGAGADSSFTDDGWIHTGDVATIDESGYVTIQDRMKDLIKSGGEWISSLQLETAILADPSVLEVAVVARPDPRWVERPVAFVVPHPGRQIDEQGVLANLRPLVPKWWLPEQIFVVEVLPRTGTGKVAKNELRAEAAKRSDLGT